MRPPEPKVKQKFQEDCLLTTTPRSLYNVGVVEGNFLGKPLDKWSDVAYG